MNTKADRNGYWSSRSNLRDDAGHILGIQIIGAGHAAQRNIVNIARSDFRSLFNARWR